MTDQLSLFAYRSAPDVSDADLTTLVGIITGRGWLTANRIHELYPTWDDRKIRAIASSSWRIISGNRGYRLLDESTKDEVREFLSRMESQAHQMQQRCAKVRTQYHCI